MVSQEEEEEEISFEFASPSSRTSRDLYLFNNSLIIGWQTHQLLLITLRVPFIAKVGKGVFASQNRNNAHLIFVFFHRFFC